MKAKLSFRIAAAAGLFATTASILCNTEVNAQGLGINNPNPHASALLDLTSTNRGLLIPRMTTAERDAINGGAPETSLLIFNITTNAYNYWDGGAWVSLLASSGSPWTRTGTRTYLTNTTDSVGIGTVTPGAPLHVERSAGSLNIARFINPTNNSYTSIYIGQTLSSGRAGSIIFQDNIDATSGYLFFGNYGDALGTGGLVVKKGGNIGIGTIYPNGLLDVYKEEGDAEVNIISENTATSIDRYPAIQVLNYMGSPAAGAGGSPAFNLINLRGNSSTTSAMLAGEALGSFSFNGSFDAVGGYHQGAAIWATGAENFSGTTAGTELSFYTTNLGSITATEKLTITSEGNVGIGAVSPAARLDITDTTAGVLIPRMTQTQRNTYVTADASELIYQTDNTPGYYYWDGTAWVRLLTSGSSGGWSTTGNTGTVDGTNFIGTTDDIPFSIRVNNQRSGYINNTDGLVFFGFQAGLNNAAGATSNTALGNSALQGNTYATQNVAVGRDALFTQSFSNTGTPWVTNNVAVGYQALYFNQPTSSSNGYRNTAVGANALRNNTTGSYNTASGLQALNNNTTGSYNTASGLSSLLLNTTGSNNTAFGTFALVYNKAGSDATAIGYGAMEYANDQLTGFTNYNVAVGFEALRGSTIAANNTGNYNTTLGYKTLWSNTSGGYNTALGFNALYMNTTGSTNTASGDAAMYYNNTGVSNTASGNYSLFYNIAGSNATAIGYNAMKYANNTVTPFTNYNVALGYEALRGSITPASNTGNYNTALGYNTLLENTSGGNNTALGYLAGQTTTAGNAVTTGSNNTFIGYNTGFASTIQRTNATAIGYNAKVDASNALILGGTGADAVNVGIGETAPTNKLQVFSNNAAIRYAGQFMNSATGGPGNIIGGVLGATDGTNAVGITKYGGLFQAAYGAGTNYGVWGEAIGGTGTNIAGYFNAVSGGNNYAIIVPSGGGNVGIGTTTPAERLEVTGNIRASSLVSASNQVVTGSSSGNLALGARMMYGRIASSGAIDGGSGGYTVTRVSAGYYRVDFTTAFASYPSVNVTSIGSGPCNNSPAATCAISYVTGCTAGDMINNFSTTLGTTNITNNASGCNGTNTAAADFTAQSVTVPLEGSFDISVQSGATYAQGFRIWIDFDQDGTFSATEDVWNSGTFGTGVFTGTITIPSSVPCGTYRMRVRCAYNCLPTAAQGCGTTCDASYGEAEDYTVTVSAVPAAISQITSVSTTNAFIGIMNTSSTLIDRGFHVLINGQ